MVDIIRENMPNSAKRAQVKGVLRPTDPGKEKFQIVGRQGDPGPTSVDSELSREAQIKLKIKEDILPETAVTVKAKDKDDFTYEAADKPVKKDAVIKQSIERHKKKLSKMSEGETIEEKAAPPYWEAEA